MQMYLADGLSKHVAFSCGHAGPVLFSLSVINGAEMHTHIQRDVW